MLHQKLGFSCLQFSVVSCKFSCFSAVTNLKPRSNKTCVSAAQTGKGVGTYRAWGPQPQGSSQLFSKRKTFILKENGSLFPVSVALFSFIRARRGPLSVVKSDTSTQIMGDC